MLASVLRAGTTAQGYESKIRAAVGSNLGTMGMYANKLGDQDYLDLSAYLAANTR